MMAPYDDIHDLPYYRLKDAIRARCSERTRDQLVEDLADAETIEGILADAHNRLGDGRRPHPSFGDDATIADQYKRYSLRERIIRERLDQLGD